MSNPFFWSADKPAQVRSGTVRRGLGNNRWLVEDAQGRSAAVYSAEVWPAGTLVVVRDGVITGRAGIVTTGGTFEV